MTHEPRTSCRGDLPQSAMEKQRRRTTAPVSQTEKIPKGTVKICGRGGKGGKTNGHKGWKRIEKTRRSTNVVKKLLKKRSQIQQVERSARTGVARKEEGGEKKEKRNHRRKGNRVQVQSLTLKEKGGKRQTPETISRPS